MQEDARKLTTASGRPYVENENTLTVGPHGPVLLQDVILHEKMAHFNRVRIPERVVHAKGAGAYGTLTVTHDITAYTRAKLFNQVGKQTRVFVRFSTGGGEKGSADTERDPRGFAVKFYTEDGNWDLEMFSHDLIPIIKQSPAFTMGHREFPRIRSYEKAYR